MILAIKGSPELLNLLTYIRRLFPDSSLATFLYAWEDIIYAFLVAVLLSTFFIFALRKKELIPSGLQNFLEFVGEKFSRFVTGILGSDGIKYVPFLGTLFLYILSMNLFGLIPLMKSPTSSLNITIALAICVFCYVQYLNIKHMGLGGFLYHLAGSPKDTLGWLVAPLMFPIELITQISRPITLALRLFGNILGEKILVSFFIVISITLLYLIPIHTPFMFLGILTGVMQALVFTLLSTIYILLSVPHHEEQDMKH